MNFKRGRAKNQRSGCLMCKRWKVNGYGKNRLEFEAFSSHKQRIFSGEALKNYFAEQMADFYDDGEEYNLTDSYDGDTMGYQYERRSYQPYVRPTPVPKPREFVASF